MKTLEEHNKAVQSLYFPAEPKGLIPTGISCPKCGTEMGKEHNSVVLLTYPAKLRITCLGEECNHVDYMYV